MFDASKILTVYDFKDILSMYNDLNNNVKSQCEMTADAYNIYDCYLNNFKDTKDVLLSFKSILEDVLEVYGDNSVALRMISILKE